MQRTDHDLTELLHAWRRGDEQALQSLVPRVQKELHRMARRYMAGDRPNHPLQTTALINEAFVRLIGGATVEWQDRSHFFAVAAQLMRRILVDMARAHKGRKRGGRPVQTTLDERCVFQPERSRDLLRLDEALHALSEIDPRKSRVVELRFFGGLSVERDGSSFGNLRPDRPSRVEPCQSLALSRNTGRGKRALAPLMHSSWKTCSARIAPLNSEWRRGR